MLSKFIIARSLTALCLVAHAMGMTAFLRRDERIDARVVVSRMNKARSKPARA